MSRWEFMRQLEELLSDISPNEREEALQYYNDYFNDAGRENEQEVIKALGSPQQVAGIVRDGLGGNENMGEFTESGFRNSSAESVNAIMKKTVENKERTENAEPSGAAEKEKEPLPVWAVVLIVLACVFLSPLILALAAVVMAAIMSVVIGVFGVCLGFGIAMAVLFIVAFALAAAGFGTLLPHPVAGIGLIGGACICAALGILFLLIFVFLIGKCIPGIFQGIGYIFKSIFCKKGGEAA